MTQLSFKFGRAPSPDRKHIPEPNNHAGPPCGAYDDCLTCPLMTCLMDVQDTAAGEREALRERRDPLLYRRYNTLRREQTHRRTIDLLTKEFKVSPRTAERIVARIKKERVK